MAFHPTADSIKDLAALYADQIGYDPFTDDPSRDPVETVETLLEAMTLGNADATMMQHARDIRSAIFSRAESLPNYRRHFPDFAPATLPAIPDGWKDVSWRNDSCPSFEAGHVHVFVNYADPAERELSEGGRFFALACTDSQGYHDGGLLDTDDWSAMLTFVAEFNGKVERLASAFSRVLREWLTPAEMALVIERNASRKDLGVCHSQDFCDANMAMWEAWEKAFGQEPPIGDDSEAEQAAFKVINVAWDVAKQSGFTPKAEA